MSTTTTRKTTARKPAAKATPAAAPKEQKPAAKPEPKTLIEALSTGQACLLKVRANGTRRSLPYLAVGTEQRKQAEAVAKMRDGGATVDAIAKSLKVSTATARRFLTNLALSHAVEAGTHNKSWKPGTREVVVHVVSARGNWRLTEHHDSEGAGLRAGPSRCPLTVGRQFYSPQHGEVV